MRAPNICAFIFASSLLLGTASAQAQQDSTERKNGSRTAHQLRFGIDASSLAINAFMDSRTSYEFQVDYHWRKDIYAVLEGGWGSSKLDYPDLKYTTDNSFARIGVDKGLLPRLTPGDWDMAFIGVRYGIGFINRSEATYTTNDPVWGTTSSTVPGKTFTAHWGEITGGIRVELLKGFFAGWNVRGKFLLNESAFRELPPSFIAGYGKGDKTTIFDFNLYFSYALRW